MVVQLIQGILKENKTATGAAVYVISFFLKKKGINIPDADIVALVVMCVGLAHKVVKFVPWSGKVKEVLVKMKLIEA